MIFVFGAGGICKKRIGDLDQNQIIGILDNDVNKQGTYLYGHRIMSPEVINNYEYEYICVLTYKVEAINKQLQELGVLKEKIRYYIDIPKIYPYIEFLEANENQHFSETVCLLTHSLEISGAPNCLLVLAKVLIKNNYNVVIGSPQKGMLLDDFLRIGASVYIDERLSTGTMRDIPWLNKINTVILNTNELYYLLRDTPMCAKIIWWLHEPTMYYKYNELMIQCLKNGAITENIRFWGVSKVAKEAMLEFIPDASIEIMPYGLEQKVIKNSRIKNRKDIKFIVIANMIPIKGYDLLIGTIKKLSENERDKCSFTFVGKNDTEVGRWVINQNAQFDLKINIIGEVSNEKALELLNESDVLICPSKQESLSVSVTEACMLGKIVICSDNTGNAYYINDGIDGLIFCEGNEGELLEKIKYVLENYEQLEIMGVNAFHIYEDIFSVEKFEHRVIQYFQRFCKRN